MSDELKPCPFCGGEVKVRMPSVRIPGPFHPLMFFCARCGAMTSFDDPLCNAAKMRGDDGPTIDAWNRRAGHPEGFDPWGERG